jgi:aspartate/tyrosine/aromatic aminotransferase
VGCFSLPNEDEDFVARLNEFLGSRIRKLYSTNSRYGSDIIKTVLGDEELKQ